MIRYAHLRGSLTDPQYCRLVERYGRRFAAEMQGSTLPTIRVVEVWPRSRLWREPQVPVDAVQVGRPPRLISVTRAWPVLDTTVRHRRRQGGTLLLSTQGTWLCVRPVDDRTEVEIECPRWSPTLPVPLHSAEFPRRQRPIIDELVALARSVRHVDVEAVSPDGSA